MATVVTLPIFGKRSCFVSQGKYNGTEVQSGFSEDTARLAKGVVVGTHMRQQ